VDYPKFPENITLTLKKCFLAHFQRSIFLVLSLITTHLKEFAGLNSLESSITVCHGIYTLTTFAPKLMLLQRLQRAIDFLLTLLFGISPSSDLSLNTVQCAQKYQTETIEAIRIIYNPITASMPYWMALQYSELPSLSDRRDKLCRDFLGNV